MKSYFDFIEDFYFFNKIRSRGNTKTLKKIFGVDEYGFSCRSKKMSNVMESHYHNYNDLHCTFCSPNKGCNHIAKRQIVKNWKKYRKHQWKE